MPDPKELMAALGQATDCVPPATSFWWQRLHANTLHERKSGAGPVPRRAVAGSTGRIVLGVLLAMIVYQILRKRTVTGAAVVPTIMALFFGATALLVGYSAWRSRRQNVVKLYSPQEVDARMVQAGNMECDCGGVMAGISFSGNSGGDGKDNRVTVSCDSIEAIEPDLAPLALFVCYLREFLARVSWVYWRLSTRKEGVEVMI